MQQLQNSINNLYLSDTLPSLDKYHSMLTECVKYREFAATVFVFDHLKSKGLTPTQTTFSIIEKLHSKTIPENSNIVLKNDNVKRLKPRRRIHKIIKGHNYTGNYNNALIHLEKVKTYLNENPELKKIPDRIKLAKNISKKCNLDLRDVRYIITNLKKTKFLVDNNNNNNNNYFSITKFSSEKTIIDENDINKEIKNNKEYDFVCIKPCVETKLPIKVLSKTKNKITDYF